jgi:hypothetical protein
MSEFDPMLTLRGAEESFLMWKIRALAFSFFLAALVSVLVFLYSSNDASLLTAVRPQIVDMEESVALDTATNSGIPESVPKAAFDLEPSAHMDEASGDQPNLKLVRIQMPDGQIVEASASGFNDFSPDQILSFDPIEPPRYKDPIRDGRLGSEPEDLEWAPQMESTLWSVASAVGAITNVECRTTFCLVTLIYGDDVKNMDLETRRSYIRGQLDYLGTMLRALIDANDRLEFSDFSTVGAPHEDFKMEFYLYGPPLQLANIDEP